MKLPGVPRQKTQIVREVHLPVAIRARTRAVLEIKGAWSGPSPLRSQRDPVTVAGFAHRTLISEVLGVVAGRSKMTVPSPLFAFKDKLDDHSMQIVARLRATAWPKAMTG
jgi:hypothetical protein